jgi:cytochrome c biogenesis protein CcmG/thiol:disulfide interchange protein DsbE
MRRLIFLVPFVVFSAFAIWFALGLRKDPATLPSALIDRPMPEFALPAVAGLDMPGLSSADIRGKVAVVNIFASWCAPCRAEHPLLMRLAQSANVTVYGVSYKDEAADSVKFLRNLGNPYKAVGFDRDGRFGVEWGVYGVPETFVVDRDGRVRRRIVGALTTDEFETLLLPLIAKLAK